MSSSGSHLPWSLRASVIAPSGLCEAIRFCSGSELHLSKWRQKRLTLLQTPNQFRVCFIMNVRLAIRVSPLFQRSSFSRFIAKIT